MRAPPTRFRSAAAAAAFAALATTAACDRPPTTEPARPSAAARFAVSASPQAPAGAGQTRRDTPWRRMSDEELTQAVAQWQGRVMIGFKAPGAPEGVNDSGRVLVDAARVRLAVQEVRAEGAQVTREYLGLPFVAATIQPSLVARLRALPSVEYVEPDLPFRRAAQDTTWNVERVGAVWAWAAGATGSGVKLLIVDSGVGAAGGHPDLAPVVRHSCAGGTGDDTEGHGTRVAGVAAALNNSVQHIGVAHGVTLWSVKDAGTTSTVACGVNYGVTNGVHVINISGGDFPGAVTSLTDAINIAYYGGIVVVAASGNESTTVSFPASVQTVIAVGATDINNVRPTFSNYGPKLELVAPGVDVPTTCLNGLPCTVRGTSYAAPHVAAAAAILKAHSPSWTPDEIRRRLMVTATDLGGGGRDEYYGWGLVNVAAAIAAPAPTQLGYVVIPYDDPDCPGTNSVDPINAVDYVIVYGSQHASGQYYVMSGVYAGHSGYWCGGGFKDQTYLNSPAWQSCTMCSNWIARHEVQGYSSSWYFGTPY